MTTEPTSILDHASLGRVEFKHWGAEVAVPFGAGTIRLRIFLGNGEPTLEGLDLVAQRLPELPALDGEARRALVHEGRAFVKSFKKSLFEDLDSATLIRQFGADKPGKIDDARFVESLQLVTVSADLDEGCGFSFSYSIDPDLPKSLDVDGEVDFCITTWGEVGPKKVPVSFEHRKLGHLEFDAEGFASTQLRLGETPILTNIQFARQPIKKRLDAPARLLADLPALDEQARAAMAEQLARGDEDASVPLYKSHHAEELGDATLLDDATFLSRLHLVRIGVDVEKRGGTIECDYSIDKDSTQYVISVRFTFAGKLREIAMES